MTTDNQKQGTVRILRHESVVLKGNPLGDKHVRDLIVYLPPGYEETGRSYPSVYCLTGFTGRGKMLLNDAAFTPNLAERMDKLIDSGRMQADDRCDARLFYILRRLAVYQFLGDRQLRGLSDR